MTLHFSHDVKRLSLHRILTIYGSEAEASKARMTEICCITRKEKEVEVRYWKRV
jgi:hypothetical protein